MILATLIVARPSAPQRVQAVGTLDPASGSPTPAATVGPTTVGPTTTLPVPPVPVATTVVAPTPVEEPVAVAIPAIGVSATVVPVGLVAGTGSIAVPPIADVGWYDLGPLPGRPGSADLVGHVDGGGRTGVFWKLRYLTPGDVITVRYGDGSERTFTVTGRAEVAKTALPADLFSRQGLARLALITCGGPFDYGTGHYVDNVVVVAAPEPGGA